MQTFCKLAYLFLFVVSVLLFSGVIVYAEETFSVEVGASEAAIIKGTTTPINVTGSYANSAQRLAEEVTDSM
jgi:uncharacterized protein (UPF0333 family)